VIIAKDQYIKNQAFSNSQTWRGFFVAHLVELYTRKNTKEELNHYQIRKLVQYGTNLEKRFYNYKKLFAL